MKRVDRQGGLKVIRAHVLVRLASRPDRKLPRWRMGGDAAAGAPVIGPRDEVLRKVLRQPATIPAALAVAGAG